MYDTTMFGIHWTIWLVAIAGVAAITYSMAPEGYFAMTNPEDFLPGQCEYQGVAFNPGDYICAGKAGVDGGNRVVWRCAYERWNFEDVCSSPENCIVPEDRYGYCAEDVNRPTVMETGGETTGNAGTPL